MPKRVRTPPPPDWEPRFLTVVYPYPPHANMEIEQHRAECARWLATCIGKDVLHALYHKPSAPNAIIIEVEREFTDWNRLLGEHKWSEVFKRCDPECKSWSSKIFWCHHASGRDVQKHGWVRFDVMEKWFNGWTPLNKVITSPYPATYFCEIPRADRTNTSICRPLPVESFPRPAPSEAMRVPPVGSEAWLRQKAVVTPDPKSAWGKGPTVFNATPPAGPSRPAGTRGAPIAKNTMPLSTGPAPSVAFQPGLPSMNIPYSGKPGSWEGPPGMKPPQAAASTIHEDWDDDIIGYTPAATVVPDTFVAGDALDDALAGLSVASVAYSEDEDDEEMLGVPASEVLERASAFGPEDDLWANYEPPTPESKPGEIICPAHGKLCSRGICRDYKALKKGRERQEAEEQKRAALAEKKLKKKLNGGTTEWQSRTKVSYTDRAERPSVIKALPSVETQESEPASDGYASSSPPASPSSPASPALPGSSKVKAKADVPSGPVRNRPAHLMKSASAINDEEGTAARPARGRRMNGNTNPPHAMNTESAAPQQQSKPKNSTDRASDGWGHVPRDPWGNPSVHSLAAPSEAADPPSAASARGAPRGRGRVGRGRAGAPPTPARGPDARSTAPGSSSGWGHIPRDQWGGQSIGGSSVKTANTAKSSVKPVKKSWADQMDDEDGKSVASSASGWGRISNGPWGS